MIVSLQQAGPLRRAYGDGLITARFKSASWCSISLSQRIGYPRRRVDKLNREVALAKRTFSLVAGLAALALSAQLAESKPVPGHTHGIWSPLAGYGGHGLTVLVSSSIALIVDSDSWKTHVALVGAEWIAGSFALAMDGEDVLILPPLDSLERCDALPSSLPMVFAEALAVFSRLDELDAPCRGKEGIGAGRIAAVFDLIDVSGDGRFPPAEISRALRAATFFIGHRMIAAERSTSFVPLEDLYVAQLVAGVLGPVVAANVIASHDYDGDGFVSPGELMQDRSPKEGLEGVVAGVAIGMAPEALSAIMNSAFGLFGWLR